MDTGGIEVRADGDIRSEIFDLLKYLITFNRSAKASLHYPMSYLTLQQHDCTYAHYLHEASLVQDPQERIKYIIAFYVSSFFINPTLLQMRLPLNPILGETL